MKKAKKSKIDPKPVKSSRFRVYTTEKETGFLTPKELPKRGDLVFINPGYAPGDEENNFIQEVSHATGPVEVIKWKPKNPFYKMQLVTFWLDGWEYTFQILPEPASTSLGSFSLVSSTPVESQPGRVTRTAVVTRK